MISWRAGGRASLSGGMQVIELSLVEEENDNKYWPVPHLLQPSPAQPLLIDVSSFNRLDLLG